ncbi:hypothetical protein VKT23_020191 [Stygiomarasmius scandens]|uniref:Uncharacterized protein n=1 Tax=Marasmiellus scandens TaxID=2682957 RepID=A0ABR1IMI9_9AGAR
MEPVPYVWGFALSRDQLQMLAQKIADPKLFERFGDNWHSILLETMRHRAKRQTLLEYAHAKTKQPVYLWVHLVVPSWNGAPPTFAPPKEHMRRFLQLYKLGDEFGKVSCGYARWPKGIATPEWFYDALWDIINSQGEDVVAIARRYSWRP